MFALGTSNKSDGAPTIPDINGLPIGVNQDLESGCLTPYKHFHDDLFAVLNWQEDKAEDKGLTDRHVAEKDSE